MASGNVVGFITNVMPPASSYASWGPRAGGGTPPEMVPVWSFDAASAEYLDFYGVLKGYDGGGLTVTLIWAAAAATSNNCVWLAGFRALPDDAEDIDAAHSYDFNNVIAAAASAAGELAYDVITFTSGADMDNLGDDQAFVLRIGRDAANGSDNMTGDAQLLAVVVTET